MASIYRESYYYLSTQQTPTLHLIITEESKVQSELLEEDKSEHSVRGQTNPGGHDSLEESHRTRLRRVHEAVADTLKRNGQITMKTLIIKTPDNRNENSSELYQP